MSRRSDPQGPFTVGGLSDRSYPTEGAAISRAISMCEHGEGDRRVGVYRDGAKVARVHRSNGATIIERVQT